MLTVIVPTYNAEPYLSQAIGSLLNENKIELEILAINDGSTDNSLAVMQEFAALVDEYGAGTLFVLEDLTGVSFSEELLSNRTAEGRRDLRSWAFYQLEQFLSYKAVAAGSSVVKVDPAFTSQRCPKCGRIRKANRKHDRHEYMCDCCGYSSNDDRIGAMNIYFLGTLFLSGDSNPRFGVRKSG